MSNSSAKRARQTKRLIGAFDDMEKKLTTDFSFGAGLSVEVADIGRIDTRQIRDLAVAQLKLVMPRIEQRLASALDAAISSPVWSWEDGSRDIVDSGELKNSLNITWNGMRAIIRYDVPYAMLVHEGGYIQPYGNPNAERVYLPGRPWIRSTLLGGGPVPQFEWEEAIKSVLQ